MTPTCTRNTTSFLLLLFVSGAWFWDCSSATAAEDFFEKRVRPVLIEHCVGCHGPKKQKGGLRLDSREALLKGGENGPAIQPGEPEKSLLIEAIRRGGDLRMPPKTPLPADTIAALTAWVKMGAPWLADRPARSEASEAWKRHWAFQPIANPPVPSVRQNNWPRASVDRFILAQLEERGLTPSAPADRRTLLRRATFDLVGLPPTPEELAAFERDSSPDAFAHVVDRLLASPHYGERWGRHWLDVARFADTKGYVFFEEKPYPWAWTYRDYVCRAFNADLPFDRFVLQQLAADQLPLGEDRRPLTALGFLTLGGHFMSNPHDIIDDRIDVMTRGLLGLTVTCARCHDHKFDPIPSTDYYALYGVFASCTEPLEQPLFEEPPRTPEYESFRKELEKREYAFSQFVQQKEKELRHGARTRAGDYLLAAHEMRDRPRIDDFMLLTDGNDLNPAMIARWQAYLRRMQKTRHPVWLPWHEFAALPEKDFAVTARAMWERMRKAPQSINPLVAQTFAEKPPQSMKDVAQRYGELLNRVEKTWNESIQQATALKKPLPSALTEPAQEELRQVFHGTDAPPDLPPGALSELDVLPDRPSQAKLEELRKAVEKWRAEGKGSPPRAHVLVDLPTPYEPYVFLRGNPNNRGESVRRQFLSLLAGPNAQPFRQGSGRLELARAIVDRQNPLTARVLVNRVWLHHFGKGLVGTPSDFGLRSEPPTHPQLLDHLATTFMDNGWSIKKLHRLILLSAVYQQASIDRAEARRVDPENVLLWRMNRRRLDFEATRDALLAVSGELDRTQGGPPISDILGSARRRTVYGFVDRLEVPGLYRSFDFPSPDASSPQRDTTTIPQQALFLMNNPFVLACARRLAGVPDVVAEKDFNRRVDLLYRRLYGRAPTTEEVHLAEAFMASGVEASRWVRYAQGLLMANEFVFLD